MPKKSVRYGLCPRNLPLNFTLFLKIGWCRPLLLMGTECTTRVVSISYEDEWTMSQTQQQSNESSQDQLESIKGSQIRQGPNRVALQAFKNELDIEKPGQKAAKRFCQRVAQKVKKGVRFYESGSGYAEPVTGASSPVKSPNPKRKLRTGISSPTRTRMTL